MKPTFISTFFVLIGACLLTFSSGCATLFSDSDYSVKIDTSPSKMEVAIVDHKGVEIFRGTSPSLVRLSAHAGYFKPARYTVKLYEDDKVVGSTTFFGKLDSWYWANLLGGGVLGMLIIDPATGAMWKLDESIFVNSGATQ